MPPSPDPRKNGFLAVLSKAELAALEPALEWVRMPMGQVLHQARAPLVHVYFPVTAIVCLLQDMENGASCASAVIGREGVVGVSAFLGGKGTTSCALVQSGGFGFRLRAKLLKEVFDSCAPARDWLLRYTQALIAHTAQSAACNRHHTLDQQLCRWLLASLDRLEGDEVVTTHEEISKLLGVRREGITEAALKLQQAGAIRYSRGHITVLARAELRQRSCECYTVVLAEYERLLGG